MSSKGTGGTRLKVNVPKVRRNRGEVRAYNDLSRPLRKSDQIVLWATAVGLFGLVLMGGLQMWRWGQLSDSPPRSAVDQVGLQASEVLGDARQLYIQGRTREAGVQARLALGLELAIPSRPSLEKDIRRLLGLVCLQDKDYSTAMDQLRWLQRHQPSASDLVNLAFCTQQLDRSRESAALEQLAGAQVLLTQGQEQRALAEARQALHTLDAQPTHPGSLQAAHLIVANIALQQGNAGLALLELKEAEKRGVLGPQHRALYHQLQLLDGQRPVRHQSVVAMTGLQVKVVLPRLEVAPAYPLGRTTGHSPRPLPREVPDTPQPLEPPQAALAPGRPAPKLELPRLQLPGEGGQPGSLPSYQDRSGSSLPSYQDQSGHSLPGYSSQSRPRDSLPGY